MKRARRSLVVGVGVAAVVAALVSPGAGAAAPEGRGPASGTTVTLLTGDRVTLVGGRARVEPGEGRERVRFLQRVDEEGDVHVLPADVAGEVAAGRLDGRLFDVGGLVRAGYDDARSPVTPLIITYDGPRLAGAADERPLPSIGGVALKADKTTAFFGAARAAGVGRIWLDGPVRATLDRSVPQIGAPAAWSAGHTGAGTTVAVLDTGIDETHPDLVGAVAGARNFSGSDTTDDRFGHGTHVAATVTGDGKYKGVAPDAKLLNGKVLDDNGGGTESDIIAGMEWAAAEGADVVNMSLGSPFPSDGTDPMSQAVNRITAETGALFVIAAGNSGPGEQSIGSPAAADAALTVGAVDRDGAIADFSSRGPRIKDGAIKPDITAPGVGIVAAKAANGIIGDPVGDKHVALSGTSMAAPHVAGAAAILAGQHPDWSAEQLKAVLVASAAPNPALSVYDQGAGLVDVARATRQPVSASPASVGLGTARWPHGDDEPIVRKLTYRNSGTAPLTLRVAVDLRDEAGKPATLVTVAPSEVTIPAGGQADVTLTADTRLDAPDGRYGGVVTATGGDTAVRTPVGLDKEVESYDVELTFLDHDGKPTPEYFYRFVDLRKPKAHVDYDPSGKLTARVPKGTYYFDAFIQTPRDGEGLWPLANFNEAGITITGDTALTLDAREGTPLDVTVDRAEARSGYAATFFTMTTDWGDTGSGIVGNDFSGITFAPSRTTAPGKAAFTVASRLAKPSGPYEFVGSPYQYSVGWTTDGGVPATLSKHFRDRDLVKVSTTAAGVATSGFIDQMAGGPLPYPITEYFSRGTTWDGSFDQSATPTTWPTDSTQLTVNPREFTRPTTQRWNAAVFGPAVPAAPWSPDEWAGRDGDNLRVSVPMFTDQDPNHFGFSTVDTAKTTLHRGETLLAQSEYDGWIQASDPGGKGTYRVHTEATRSVSPLSTFISADWTFTSATTQSAEPLPLIAVRFAPNLDTTNHAPAGRLFTVPIYTQHNGTTATTVTKPTIQVSYNDGKTWTPTPVVRVGDRWHAILHHPANAKFVSFKAQAKDTQDNAVDQTIIRAYALK